MDMRIAVAALIVLVVVASGCTSPTTPTTPLTPLLIPTATGNLVMQITDKPVSGIEKVMVTVSDVQVHPAAAGNDSDELESSWIPVTTTGMEFNLMEIKDIKVFLGSTELPAGHYTQVRLTVESATATIGGTDHNLTIPSKIIRIVKGFDVPENGTAVVTLDFNANDSIEQTGKGYLMKPVIAVQQESAESGASACVRTGGKVHNTQCFCEGASDFPDNCVVGGCTCNPMGGVNYTIRSCDCGERSCFNGSQCTPLLLE